MSRPVRPTRLVALIASVSLLAVGCGGGAGSSAADRATRIVATTSILGDIVRSVVADSVEVEVLMPPGTDPHSFAPSAAAVSRVRSADLVVTWGLGLEATVGDVLTAAAADGTPVVALAEHADPQPFADGLAAVVDDDHEPGKGEPLDPHVWFDPTRVAAALEAGLLPALRTALPDVLPAGGPGWDARVAAVVTDLAALDVELRDALAVVPADRRTIVTNHEAFGYLAARYDLEVVGTVIPGGTTSAGANARDFVALVEQMQARGIGVIFVEAGIDRSLAETVARQTEGTVTLVELYSDSLGAREGDPTTYADLLRTDVTRIVDALTGDAP